MKYDTVIGIDLGTTNSEAAHVVGGVPTVFASGQDRGIVPSAVGLDRDGRILVGREARNQYAAAPDRTILSIKRRMGSDERIALGPDSYRPQEISAFILRTLADRASLDLGHKVGRAVITVPAFFSDAQRQATREAGTIAGLEVVRILNEPTAAALAYQGGSSGKGRILVYDLGGGTFDVSIVSMEDGVVEVLASNGDTRLGGDDFDTMIVERLIRHIEDDLDLAVGDNPLLRSRLLHAAEAAKIELSTRPYARIAEDHIGTVGGKPVHLEYELPRRDFETMIDDALDRTLSCVSRALRDAQLAAHQIDKVLLVGGSTRIPRVAELLRSRLGQEPHGEIDPDLSVALGAAVQGGIEMGVAVHAVLVDITPYTFGTSAIGDGPDGEPIHDKFYPLIRRNSKLPCEHSEVFYTEFDDQDAVDVTVYQGEHPRAGDNLHIANFKLDGLNQKPGYSRQGLVFTYRLNLDGILEVQALERASGREIKASIDNALGRSSEGELLAAQDRFAKRWATHADPAAGDSEATDDQPRGAPTAPPRIADTLRRAEQTLAKASAEDRAEINQLVAAIHLALEQSRPDDAESARQELDEILFYLE